MSIHHLHSVKWTLVILLSCAASSVFAQQRYVLDDFENGSVRIVQPKESSSSRFLWNLYSGLDYGNGTVTVVDSDRKDGQYALKVTLDSGSTAQLQLYTYTYDLSGWGNGWQYLRKIVNNPTMASGGGSPAWQYDTFNRLKFWIKVPPGYKVSSSGRANAHFGTYIRNSSTATNVAESSNQHYYHYLNFNGHGQWEQVIIDMHPDHQRGASGDAVLDESPNRGETGRNYFDLMTRFYIEIFNQVGGQSTYLDGFEFYRETNLENTAQVRSVHAAYIPGSNMLDVGWTRAKDEVSVKHEVRYSFSSIHANGWNSATPAPSGTVSPTGDGGYNTMRWTGSVDVSGHDVIYVAIKPQNSSLFRQIAIPLTDSEVVAPLPPAGVTVD